MHPRGRIAALLLAAAALAPHGAADAQDAPARVLCRLPFPADVSWRVQEGNDQGTHKDDFNRYAFDFAMQPEGQPVCAVMDGTVEFVKKDENEATGNDKDNNKVVVRHDDGSLAEYVHLEKDGAYFEVGERVIAGDVVGLSGNTGRSTGPHLHFGLRKGDKDGKSVPCRFVEVEGDGVPKTDQTVRSQNAMVRESPGWRETRGAIDLYKFCAQIRAAAVALPLLEAARKSPPKLVHPSIEALLRERDEVIDLHKQDAQVAVTRVKDAKEARDLDALAELATYGVLDFADVPATVKELRAIPAAFGKDPGWAASMQRLAQRAEYRKLVADAVKEEMTASTRFIVKRNDPKARPDYAAAVVAWERARARAPDPDMGSAIRRHGEALKKSR